MPTVAQLPAASTPMANDLIPISQGGVLNAATVPQISSFLFPSTVSGQFVVTSTTAGAPAYLTPNTALGPVLQDATGHISAQTVLATGGASSLGLGDFFANLSLASALLLTSLATNQAAAAGFNPTAGTGTGNANTIFGLATAGAATGLYNTVYGYGAMNSSGASNNNCMFGFAAGANLSASSGSFGQHSAFGTGAMQNETTGSFNSGFGSNAGRAFFGAYGCLAVGHGAFGQSDGLSGTPAVGKGPVLYSTAVGNWSQQFGISGQNNTSVGYNALLYNGTGSYNTVVGALAAQGAWSVSNVTALGYNAVGAANVNLGSGSSYSYLTAVGCNALQAITTGTYNVAVGGGAAQGLTTGTQNVFLGDNSGFLMTTGGYNVLAGFNVAFRSTTTNYSTIVGMEAGGASHALSNITALGFNAAGNNGADQGAGSSLSYLTAIGVSALQGVTTGTYNVAVGNGAGYSATTTSQNALLGDNSGFSLTVGGNNLFAGYRAGFGGNTNQQSTVDTNCTFLGYVASRDNSISQATVLTNMTVIGAGATGNLSNAAFIGNSSVTALYVGGISGTGLQALLSAAVSSSTTNTNTNKIKVVLNGTTYYLLASTSAT